MFGVALDDVDTAFDRKAQLVRGQVDADRTTAGGRDDLEISPSAAAGPSPWFPPCFSLSLGGQA